MQVIPIAPMTGIEVAILEEEKYCIKIYHIGYSLQSVLCVKCVYL